MYLDVVYGHDDARHAFRRSVGHPYFQQAEQGPGYAFYPSGFCHCGCDCLSGGYRAAYILTGYGCRDPLCSGHDAPQLLGPGNRRSAPLCCTQRIAEVLRASPALTARR